MPDQPDTADIDAWHRYFAIENNNRAWDLAAASSRTPDESREMLNAAHSAAGHWQAVGTDLNNMRARMLLAEVHALLGFGPSALELAAQVRDYFLNRTTDDWELAFVHTIHAHAAAAAADAQTHADSYLAAESAIAAIAADEDRAIVLQTFNQVPKPG
jgi:hypothetical protein